MKFLLFTIIFTLISIGTTVFAAEYKSMVNIPRVNDSSFTIKEYIQAVYFLIITAAGLLAVVKIIYAGVQYMLDGVVTHKEQAKKEIMGAMFGLLIIISAVLILNTINPHLTELDIFRNAPKIEAIIPAQTSATRQTVIGDTHGQFCMGSNIWETLTTFECSSESKSELENWKRSCLNDAKGTIKEDFFTGYTCIAK